MDGSVQNLSHFRSCDGGVDGDRLLQSLGGAEQLELIGFPVAQGNDPRLADDLPSRLRGVGKKEVDETIRAF